MKLSRRGFLRTTLAAVGMQAGANVQGAIRAILALPVHVIVMAECSAGESFCGAMPQPARRFSFDVAEVLQDLASGRGAEAGSVCLGLTRESDHLLIRQILIERGSVEIYRGRHEIAGRAWRHELHGSPTVIEALVAAVTIPGSDWAGAIAGHAQDIAARSDSGARTRRTFISRGTPVSPGPACLVSWAYRVGTART